jgi:hypothetical protein
MGPRLLDSKDTSGLKTLSAPRFKRRRNNLQREEVFGSFNPDPAFSKDFGSGLRGSDGRMPAKQCCGSGFGSVGSVTLWASRIRIHHFLFGSGSGPGSGSFHHQASKQNLEFYCSETCQYKLVVNW